MHESMDIDVVSNLEEKEGMLNDNGVEKSLEVCSTLWQEEVQTCCGKGDEARLHEDCKHSKDI